MRLQLLPLAVAFAVVTTDAAAMGDADWHLVGPTKPAEQGEGITVGRINIVAFDPRDRFTIYAGTSGSGLWRTKDGGANWTLLTKDLPVLGVSERSLQVPDTVDEDKVDARFENGVLTITLPKRPEAAQRTAQDRDKEKLSRSVKRRPPFFRRPYETPAPCGIAVAVIAYRSG